MGSASPGRLRKISKALDYDRCLNWIVLHPLIVVAMILLCTVALGWRLPKLQIRASSYEIAIKDIEATKNYENFLREFGGGEYIQVIAKTSISVFEPEVFRHLEALADSLAKIPGVVKVVSLPDAKRDMDLLDEWSVAQFEKIIKPVKLFDKNLVSLDKKSTAFTLLLMDIKQEESIVSAVDAIIKNEKSGLFSLYSIGMPIVSQTLLATIKRDFAILPPITLLVMILTLFAFFRSVRLIIPPVATILVCLVWTFGIMAWTDKPVSSLSLVVPIILMAVGTAYCMHVLSEYVQVAKTARTRAEAAAECIRQVQLPTILTILASLIGFAPQLFSPMQIIREFSLPSCLGILAFLILIVTFFPAVLAIFPLPGEEKRRFVGKDRLDRLLSAILALATKKRRTNLIVFAILTVIGTVGVAKLKIEADTTKYFRDNSPVTRHFHDVYKDMSGSFPINVVLDADKENYFRNPANLAKIMEVQRYLESVPGIDKTISFSDYMMLINYSVNNYGPESYSLPRDESIIPNLLNLYKMVLGKEISKRFMRDDFSKTSILMMMHISSSHQWLETEKLIREYCQKRWGQDFSVNLTSMGVVVAHSNAVITANLIQGLFYVIVLLFCIMLVLFLSLKVGLIAIIPSIFPLVVVFGLMGWLDIELSMNTAMIATIAIGLAVDDTLHFLSRYNTSFKTHLDQERALSEAMSSAGRAKILTTVTICLGFSILMLSSFKPTAMFGGLLVATLMASILGDLIVLPSALMNVEFLTAWDLVRVRLGPEPTRLIPLFSGLSRFQVRTILGSGTIVDFPENHVFSLSGSDREFLHTILSGEVGIYYAQSAQDARNGIRVTTFRTGDVIADVPTDRWYKESAFFVCATPVEMLMINPRTIRRLQWLYPPAASRFITNYISILADRLDRTTRMLATSGYRDDITGLTSPVTFPHAVEIETERIRRYGGKLSVLILEVVSWREMLRSSGFSASDKALSILAQNLANQLRCFDIMCRLDDWKFAVLLIHAGPAETAAVTRRLKALSSKLMEEGLPPLVLASGAAYYASGIAPSAQELISYAISDLERDRLEL